MGTTIHDRLDRWARRTLATTAGIATFAMAMAFPAYAQSDRFPVSPTGIAYTVPAAARAAGWTLADSEARLGLMGSNPVFLAGGAQRALAADAAWEHRDLESSVGIDQFESRISSLTGKMTTGGVALGLSYQRPFRAQFDGTTTPTQQELQVLVGGAAIDLLPILRVGASLSGQFVDGVDKVTTYQATLGAETQVGPVAVAGAVKSQPFGSDADRVAEPGWFQLDARAGLGPVIAVGARLGVGWWNNSLQGALEAPVDLGVGASWGVLPTVRVLGGVHHIRERLASIPTSGAPSLGDVLTGLDQGTFLDVGVHLGLPVVGDALAVEDSHVFGADSPSTWVTLSATAGF